MHNHGAVIAYVRAFAGVFIKRSSGLLDRWITQVNNDWIAPLT